MNEEKPERECPYCNKTYRNLGQHIANAHPTILDKIEESADSQPLAAKSTPISRSPQPQSISDMIREKLDLMLNIKVIEMLSSSKDTNIQDIATAINPPKNTSLSELKEFHDLVYKDKEESPAMIETGNQWVDIAQQAIPMIRDMLPSKKAQIAGENKNVSKPNNERPRGTLKPICLEITGSTRESSSDSPKPRIDGETKQQDNRSSTRISPINEC